MLDITVIILWHFGVIVMENKFCDKFLQQEGKKKEKDYDKLLKILLLGDKNVGKTEILFK